MKQDYEEKVAPERLEASRSERERLLKKWGFEPISMWWETKVHNATLDALVEDHAAKERSYQKNNFNTRDGALSQSSPVIAERIIKFWSEPGDICCNPFCERLPHLLVANYLGRHAIGQDLCEDFYKEDVAKVKQRVLANAFLAPDDNKIIEESVDSFKSIFNGLRFDLYHGDSRILPLDRDSIDFIISSPPYWDTEDYGPDPRQLGTGTQTGQGDAPTYEEFLGGLQQVFKECERVLRPGKFAVFIVNDFRKSGRFYIYHSDCLRLCEHIGLIPWDLITYNLSAHPLQSIFLSQLERDHHTAKCSEFILVFRKPE